MTLFTFTSSSFVGIYREDIRERKTERRRRKKKGIEKIEKKEGKTNKGV